MKISNVREYLTTRHIQYAEHGNELITKCLFNQCDTDSTGNEAHLYFSALTGQYDCKKCGEKGNLITLSKFLGEIPHKESKQTMFGLSLIQDCVGKLPERILKYLEARGISREVTASSKLGYGKFYGKHWITIPVKNASGEYTYFKLRQDPDYGNEKGTFPKGGVAQLYRPETQNIDPRGVVLCEGELDCLALISRGIPAVTSTHGAGTFKKEWADSLKENRTFICFDNDDAGRSGARRAAQIIHDAGGLVSTVSLPKTVGEHGDITDYITKIGGDCNDLFSIYASDYPEKIDSSQFKEMTINDLSQILELTIKHDATNKVATFLGLLSAFTEESQLNISFNSPSSTGKSYIPTEIATLFPKEDVIEIGYCSTSAFFHDHGNQDPEDGLYKVDLSRKIIIFLDQPHSELLSRLRPLLSHDKKEIVVKITDKTDKGGMRTKNIKLIGYPSVVFCTASVNVDEQESTRFLLLSPEINSEKTRAGVMSTINKSIDEELYRKSLADNPERVLLIQRILSIRDERIANVNIRNSKLVEESFLSNKSTLKPRHQRDIKKFMSLIKVIALLNLWWRERSGDTIYAEDKDIIAALEIWKHVSESQEVGLPPYIFNIYREVILPTWEKENSSCSDTENHSGISRQKIISAYFRTYGRMLDINTLRMQILPMLETAGLISQEFDIADKRRVLISPLHYSLHNKPTNND